MFIPIDRQTLILKNGGKWSFFGKTKASIHLSKWGEWLWGAQSLIEKRLSCESVFILINWQTLIVKMVEWKAFLMKPKHQCHLSQLQEYVYCSSLWKERRLFCESVFAQINRQTLILKW